jgi:hypothetical protein
VAKSESATQQRRTERPDSSTSGNLYGITSGGVYSNGSVFELLPDNDTWTEKLLFSFNQLTDSESPGNLMLDASENLYGTTPYGRHIRLRHRFRDYAITKRFSGSRLGFLNRRQDFPVVWCRG